MDESSSLVEVAILVRQSSLQQLCAHALTSLILKGNIWSDAYSQDLYR